MELVHPATGWPAPHHIALIELEESVRVLALAGAAPLEIGSTVEVERDGERYQIVGSNGPRS